MTKKQTKKRKSAPTETDSTYFLKIVLYFILGTLWVRLVNVNVGPFQDFSVPLGLILGLVFTSHEHFQIDRKIEYAVLLAATMLSFYLPVGISL